MIQGLNRGNIYEWPAATQITQHIVHSSIVAPVDMWHRRLSHPSSLIQHKLLSSFSLPISKSHSSITHCDAFLSNKSHQQLFSPSSISTSKPFEIIYTDVWGPAPILYFGKFIFYVIFIDHFTKYT